MIPPFTVGIALGDKVSAVATDETGTVVSRSASELSGAKAISEVIDRIHVDRIEKVMVAGLLGTKGLPRPVEKIGVLRIAEPSSTCISPMSGWPRRFARSVVGCVATVSGGHHFDGSPRSPLDSDAVARFALECRDKGIRAVAIVGTNSQSAPGHEQQAAHIVTEIVGPRTHLVLGSTMPGIGVIERENTAAIEAALVSVALRRVDAISSNLKRHGIDTELHVVAGTGTLMSVAELIAHPSRVYQSYVASALIGVAHEFGLDRSVVLYVDPDNVRVFTVSDGVPHQTHSGESLFGVPTTVAALRSVMLDNGDHERIAECIERIRLWMGDVPAVRIFPGDTAGNGRFDLPGVTDSALGGWTAAIGAASAQVGGFTDRVFNFADSTYDEAVRIAKAEAIDAAVRAGADPLRVEVARLTDTPLTYVASNSIRLSAMARGPLL